MSANAIKFYEFDCVFIFMRRCHQSIWDEKNEGVLRFHEHFFFRYHPNSIRHTQSNLYVPVVPSRALMHVKWISVNLRMWVDFEQSVETCMLIVALQHTQSLAIFINNRILQQKDMRIFQGGKEGERKKGVRMWVGAKAPSPWNGLGSCLLNFEVFLIHVYSNRYYRRKTLNLVVMEVNHAGL